MAASAPREIQGSLDPQCLSGFRKNEKFEIERSDVILTVDNGDFVFLDCAYEELLQSLGPINDTTSVPWTMFNDNVSMGYFDVYDQYLLNMLYNPRIKAGMTVAEVKAVLPDVLADVRDVGEEGEWSAGVMLARLLALPRRLGPSNNQDCSRHHPRKLVIQYTAAYRFNHRRLWNTGSHGQAGRRQLCVGHTLSFPRHDLPGLCNFIVPLRKKGAGKDAPAAWGATRNKPTS